MFSKKLKTTNQFFYQPIIKKPNTFFIKSPGSSSFFPLMKNLLIPPYKKKNMKSPYQKYVPITEKKKEINTSKLSLKKDEEESHQNLPQGKTHLYFSKIENDWEKFLNGDDKEVLNFFKKFLVVPENSLNGILDPNCPLTIRLKVYHLQGTIYLSNVPDDIQYEMICKSADKIIENLDYLHLPRYTFFKVGEISFENNDLQKAEKYFLIESEVQEVLNYTNIDCYLRIADIYEITIKKLKNENKEEIISKQEKIFNLYQQAYSKGSTKNLNIRLGICHYLGKGTPVDKEKALGYFWLAYETIGELKIIKKYVGLFDYLNILNDMHGGRVEFPENQIPQHYNSIGKRKFYQEHIESKDGWLTK